MQIDELFVSILNMSITASYAIVAVIILRLLLKRASKWITCVLWGIASVRLIFPFSLESILSVFSVIPSTDTVTPEILYSDAPTIHSGIHAVNTTVNPVISQSMAPAADASVNPLQVIAYIAGIVWAFGIAVLLVYSIVTYIKLRRKTMTATLLKNNVYQSENIVSPFLLGFIKPKIFVSYNTTEPELSHVISHENAHIRRRDYLLKPLASLMLTLHWFNPLVWVAYILFCRDIELACDEKVIKGMSVDERKSYSEALLGLSKRSCRIPACPLAFGEVSVKERVKKTLSYKKPAFWIIIVALAACVVTALCLLTDPVQTSEPDPVHTPEMEIGSEQEPDSTNIISNTDTTDGTINDVSELYGIYHPTEVIYVNPLSSFYPYDLETAPYYTIAENVFTVKTQNESTGFIMPKYNRSKLKASEFDSLFEMNSGKPDVSYYDSIERITITNEYSLFIVGTELWLVDTNGGDHIWLIYKLELSTPEKPPLIQSYSQEEFFGHLTIDELARIIRDKGNNLTWSDFAQLEHYDIGSGLYIWQVPINKSYCVLIGGSNSDTDPMYVRLVKLYPNGEITDEYLDLLDENTDVHSFFMENFGIGTQPLTWPYIPYISSVFPALPLDIDLRYSTVDITVDSGTLYHRIGGYTQISEQTYTYNSGETIYWSPHAGDSFEDITDSCTLSFSIKNAQDEVFASGKIYIQKIEQPEDYSTVYSITLAEAPEWLQLGVNTSDNLANGFILTSK